MIAVRGGRLFAGLPESAHLFPEVPEPEVFGSESQLGGEEVVNLLQRGQPAEGSQVGETSLWERVGEGGQR